MNLGGNYAISGLEPRGSDPTARLLRVAAIARDLESGRYPACDCTGAFTAALNEYQLATAAWFGKESARYELWMWRRAPKTSARTGLGPTVVMRPDLEVRREELREAIAAPGGALLERAPWSLRHESRSDARALAGQLMMQFPRSPLTRDARSLSRLADYQDALDLAAADDPRDVAGAQERLDKLASEPGDVPASLA